MVVGDVGKIFKLEEKNDAMTQEIILSSLLVDFWEGLPVLLLFEVDTWLWVRLTSQMDKFPFVKLIWSPNLRSAFRVHHKMVIFFSLNTYHSQLVW